MTNGKSGDKVKVRTKDEIIEGILMPNEETDSIIIKLNNGYNIGIKKNKIKDIKVLKQNEKEDIIMTPLSNNKDLPTISILHTGGTIASKVDYKTGGVVARFEPEELINMFPELKEITNIRSKLIANMFSEDMRFSHYQLMIKGIRDEIKKNVDGIILTHGTDTMGYTAAALAFALENPSIPIIIVGAQRSSDRGSSDAAVNLICAAEFITKTDFAGVAICMHKNTDDNTCIILPPCKTRKMHTSRRDAFKPINDTAIATISFKDKKIEFLKKDYTKKDKKKEAIIKDNFEERVGIIKCHPNMFPKEFESYEGYKGLIMEGTGLGHAPISTPNIQCEDHAKNLAAIKNLIKNGTIIVMTSQTIFGKVQMHVYSSGIDLVNAGIIPGEDMLTETAFIKLAWLLGNYKNKEEIKRLLITNLRGEINERLEPNMFLKE